MEIARRAFQVVFWDQAVKGSFLELQIRSPQVEQELDYLESDFRQVKPRERESLQIEGRLVVLVSHHVDAQPQHQEQDSDHLRQNVGSSVHILNVLMRDQLFDQEIDFVNFLVLLFVHESDGKDHILHFVLDVLEIDCVDRPSLDDLFRELDWDRRQNYPLLCGVLYVV